MLKGMRRLLIAAAIFVALVVALVGASGYLLRGLVEGQREALLAALSRRAGVRIQVERAQFDVAAWYQLRPALALHGVKVSNPPGYKEPHLLTADRIDLRVALRPLLQRRIEVETLVLESPRFVIERNRQGISNLETFTQGTRGEAESQGVAMRIQSLVVHKGDLRLAESAVPRMREIDLTMTDVVPGQAVDSVLKAKLYEGKGSSMTFAGKAGPFTDKAAPLEGKAELTLALADVPAAVRQQQFGSMLLNGVDKAVVRMAGTVKGDLYRTVTAGGRFTVEGMKVGRDAGHLLPLGGQARLLATVSKLMSTPTTQLQLREGLLKVGAGEWKGTVDLLMVGGVVRGKSAGSISKLDINQFLGAFTSADNRMSGQLHMPSYSLRFAGRDADQLKRSLTGEAKMTVMQGRLKALDMVASIRRAVERTGMIEGDQKDTDFTTLNVDLALAGGTITASGLVVEGPALAAHGAGTIAADQALQFKMTTLVRGRVAELLGQRKVGTNPAEAAVPIEIGGTVQNPRVTPNVAKMAVSTGLSYLQDLLKKRLEDKKQ